MCLGACLNARVPRVVYGAPEPKAGACGSAVDLTRLAAYNHTIDAIGGVEADAAAELMRTFFQAVTQTTLTALTTGVAQSG